MQESVDIVVDYVKQELSGSRAPLQNHSDDMHSSSAIVSQ